MGLLEQNVLSESIAQIVDEEAGEDYDTAACEFEPFGEDDEATVSTALWVTMQGVTVNNAILTAT